MQIKQLVEIFHKYTPETQVETVLNQAKLIAAEITKNN